jgi:uridine kinase
MTLRIAEDLDLPQEIILSKVGIVGMSGSGKTQTARKLAEGLR